jgi:hypothetical protein
MSASQFKPQVSSNALPKLATIRGRIIRMEISPESRRVECAREKFPDVRPPGSGVSFFIVGPGGF